MDHGCLHRWLCGLMGMWMNERVNRVGGEFVSVYERMYLYAG
jgi:hypothetical protein